MGGEGDALVGQLGVVHPAVRVAVVGEVVLQRAGTYDLPRLITCYLPVY